MHCVLNASFDFSFVLFKGVASFSLAQADICSTNPILEQSERGLQRGNVY